MSVTSHGRWKWYLRSVLAIPVALIGGWLAWFLVRAVNIATFASNDIRSSDGIGRAFIEIASHASMGIAMVWTAARVTGSRTRTIYLVAAVAVLVLASALGIVAAGRGDWWAVLGSCSAAAAAVTFGILPHGTLEPVATLTSPRPEGEDAGWTFAGVGGEPIRVAAVYTRENPPATAILAWLVDHRTMTFVYDGRPRASGLSSNDLESEGFTYRATLGRTDEEKAKIRTLYHRLWSRSQSVEHYVKSDWMELGTYLGIDG